jgi:hypothetical protein
MGAAQVMCTDTSRHTRAGGIRASRASICPRTTPAAADRTASIEADEWNEFLPISIATMVTLGLLDAEVLRLTLAASLHHSPAGQEHGRIIPFADHANFLRAFNAAGSLYVSSGAEATNKPL